jgi:outer membrane protein assembly factor BamB
VSRATRVAVVAGCAVAAAAAGAGAIVVVRRVRAARRRAQPPPQRAEPAPRSSPEPAPVALPEPVVDAPLFARGDDVRDAPASRLRIRRGPRVAVIAAVVVVMAAIVGVTAVVALRDSGEGGGRAAPPANIPGSTAGAAAAPAPFEGWVDPASAGRPYYDATIPGLLTFRGNPTRTYYGQGPMPSAPRPVWRYPGAAMCSVSEDRGEVSNWCGTGWTGEPAVFERDGRTWLVFGAYDRAVHFVDAASGEDILPPFPTGDLIKGSVTIDPHGFPLVYVGSRDGLFRVLAFDRPQPTELWRLSANDVSPTKWNDDWDGSSLVLGDYLFEGGENSQMHVVKLNRGRAPDGTVTIAPSLAWNAPGWDDQLLAEADNEVSIENSVAISGDTLYFANSGGLVQGWDISGLRTGTGPPQRVFRFWTGEDTDASVVVDEQGMLYVGSEWEKHRPRAAEVGQMMKLDPHRADNPLVWSQKDEGADKSGVWGTPGVSGDLVIFTTYSGRAVGIDRATGVVRWEKRLPAPVMGSPSIVDGIWLQGDCDGVLHAYDVRNTTVDPPEVWQVPLGNCIESTPAVWNGRVYVGTRGGFVYGIGDG